MSHKRQVIATGINNLTDARYFAAMGVHWMGFDLRAEPRIPQEQMQAIMDWVEGPQWLVETKGSSMLGIPEGVSGIVHPPNQHPEAWKGTCIQRMKFDEFKTQHSGLSRPETVLVELEPGDHGKFLELVDSFPQDIWLRTQWTEQALGTIMTALPHAGIVLSGGTEEAVGIKDYVLLDALFELLEL